MGRIKSRATETRKPSLNLEPSGAGILVGIDNGERPDMLGTKTQSLRFETAQERNS
jgi:hypothetical protein